MGAPVSQQQYFNPNKYVIPAGYKETESIWQRIFGVLTFNIDIVEEIERREDLDKEGRILLGISLFVSFLANVIFEYLYPSTNSSFVFTFARLFITYFVGFPVYILAIAYVGKGLGGAGTETSPREIIRLLGYGLIATAIAQLLINLGNISLIIGLAGILAYIWAILVFMYCIKRALDQGWGLAFATVIIALILRFIASGIVQALVSLLLGVK